MEFSSRDDVLVVVKRRVTLTRHAILITDRDIRFSGPRFGPIDAQSILLRASPPPAHLRSRFCSGRPEERLFGIFVSCFPLPFFDSFRASFFSPGSRASESQARARASRPTATTTNGSYAQGYRTAVDDFSFSIVSRLCGIYRSSRTRNSISISQLICTSYGRCNTRDPRRQLSVQPWP